MTDLEVRSLSIDRMVCHWALAEPDKTAMRYQSVSISFSQLCGAILKVSEDLRCMADSFDESGLLCIVSQNPINLVVFQLAAVHRGMNSVIGNSQWTSEISEKFLTQSDIISVVHDGSICSQLASSSQKIGIPIQEIVPELQSTNRELPLSDSKPFSLSLLTSGSTGVPKIVQKTAYSLISEIFTWIVELNISRNTNTSVFQPIYYSAAWFYTFSTLAAGGSVHFGVRRPESIFLEELRASVSSHLILVPSQYRRLCEAFGKDEVLSCIKDHQSILIVGEKMDEEARDELRNCCNELVEMWGNTEGLGALWVGSENQEGRRPFLGDKLELSSVIGQTRSGHDVGPVSGFSDADASSNEVIDSDDVGYFKSGRLFILGRTSEVLINSSGLVVEYGTIKSKLKEQGIFSDLYPIIREGGNVGIALHVDQEITDKTKEILNNTRDILKDLELEGVSIGIVRCIPLISVGKVDRDALSKNVQWMCF